MVATKTIKRGLLLRRRITSSSIIAPMSAPATIMTGSNDERDVEVEHDLRQREGTERTELALGEVDHLSRAVDEHQRKASSA